MKRAFIYIIFAGILWGTSGFFVKALSPYGVTAPQMSFFRAAVSLAVIGGFAAFADRSVFRVRPRDLPLLIASGVALFGTGTCYYTSMQMTSVSTAVVLMYTAPILVMLYSVTFLGEKLTWLKSISVGGMLVGCALVSGVIGGMRFDAVGVLVGIGSGISYAAYNILTKLQMRRGIAPLSATFYCFLTAACVSFFACKPATIPACIAKDPLSVWLLILGIGIMTYVLPYFFYTNSLKVLPVGTASALGIVEPMAATVFSILFFHEQLTVASGCGILLILGSTFLLSRSKE